MNHLVYEIKVYARRWLEDKLKDYLQLESCGIFIEYLLQGNFFLDPKRRIVSLIWNTADEYFYILLLDPTADFELLPQDKVNPGIMVTNLSNIVLASNKELNDARAVFTENRRLI